MAIRHFPITRHCQNGLKCMLSTSIHQKPQTLFSGIQPTGVPHLGNYLGAIRQWRDLQEAEDKRCIFSVVDLHSLTSLASAEKRRNDIQDTVISLLACGIDPKKSILFQQSCVYEHSELCWILTCLTTENRLKQVPQWKEKAKLQKNFSFGLIAYPVLMSADVMLYKADLVPVGEDQIQHLQLCRDLAGLFNTTYNTNLFPKCDWIVTEAARVRNLRNPANKMSKSDHSEKSRINLDDSPENIKMKIKRAVTDNVGRVYYDPQQRPGVSNLMTIHSSLTGESMETIEKCSDNMDTGLYKLKLADIIVERLRPIREEMERLRHEKQYVQEILTEGQNQAQEMASQTMKEVKLTIGLKV